MDYTKGPWKLELINNERITEWRITALSNAELVGDFQLNEEGVMEVATEREEIEIASRWLDEPVEELEANMQLIAASPDLFNASVIALEELRKSDNPNPFILKYLENTLQKATGGLFDTRQTYEEVKEELELHKEYFVYEQDEEYNFVIEFNKLFRNQEDPDDEDVDFGEDSYYEFSFDKNGTFLDADYSLTMEFEHQELEEVKRHIQNDELKNIQMVASFLKQSTPYLRTKHPKIFIKRVYIRDDGNIATIEFTLGKEENDSLYCFVNESYNVRRIYLENKNDYDNHIEISPEIFYDFNLLIENIQRSAKLFSKKEQI